jgi:hypothetical protein
VKFSLSHRLTFGYFFFYFCRYADRYGTLDMSETTPPPDDHFPKVFSMASGSYQAAGYRGGQNLHQEQKDVEDKVEDEEGREEREELVKMEGNETGEETRKEYTVTEDAVTQEGSSTVKDTEEPCKGRRKKERSGVKKTGIKKGRSSIEEAVRQKQLMKAAAAAAVAAADAEASAAAVTQAAADAEATLAAVAAARITSDTREQDNGSEELNVILGSECAPKQATSDYQESSSEEIMLDCSGNMTRKRPFDNIASSNDNINVECQGTTGQKIVDLYPTPQYQRQNSSQGLFAAFLPTVLGIVTSSCFMLLVAAVVAHWCLGLFRGSHNDIG